MTERDDRSLDESIIDAWSDIQVTDDLKASTMAAIHAARLVGSESAAEKGRDGEAAVGEADGIPDLSVVSGGKAGKHGKGFSRGRRRLIVGLVAAALCLMSLGVGGNVVYHTETAYAQVSSQATVTLGVNRFGKVVRVTVAQADLQDELDSLHLTGRNYDDAISALTSSGYLGGTEVNVQVGGNASEQEQALATTTTSCLENAGCSGTCNGQGYGEHDGSGAGAGNGSHDGTGSGAGNGNGHGNGNVEGKSDD